MARDTATPAGRNGRMLGGSKLLLVLLAGGVGTVLAPGAGAQDASFVARTGAVVSVGASQDLDLSQGLPTDPRIVRGVLPNGLTYMVMRHGNPPGKMNIWLHVSTGSLNETDAQRGIAHYLEHMAFNGSTNFAPGTVIDFFQSMGLNFGQHQNAFTSFDQTAYQLTMPDLKPETIDKAMLFMADVKGRLLLTQEEIEAERQVIMEEKRARLNPQMRMLEKMLPRQFPGSIIGSRMPIGVEETIMGMNRDEFVNYYTKWYVPSNMTVMVVADMDPAEVVKHIEKNFSFGEKTPRPVDVPANVTPYTDDGAIVEQDAEVTDASIAMVRVSANRPPSTTIGDMRRDLVEQMASAAFGRRIADKLSKGGTSYTSAGAFGQSLFNAAFLAQASAEGEPNQWKEMLTELGADVQRARLHGFTQRELDDIKKEIMSGAELAVEREGTVPARAVMGRWNSAVAAGEPIMGAAQELAILRSVLPTITPQDVSTVFAGMFEPKNVRFTLTLPASETAPSESELLSLGQQAFAVTPEPLVEEARASS